MDIPVIASCLGIIVIGTILLVSYRRIFSPRLSQEERDIQRGLKAIRGKSPEELHEFLTRPAIPPRSKSKNKR